MGDLFRSAMNYLSQASGAAGVGGSQVHPLVGTTIKLSGISYRVRSQLAEGGYALVFAVQDSQGNWFALKRQLAVDRAATQAITQEINFMRELSGSPNIVRFVQANRQELKDSPGLMEFFMLMELCTGGTLIELIQKEVLTPAQISKIFYAVCCAVQHMHDRSPPITHRDLKIENLLFDSRGFIRLCDFGSATTEIFRPDDNWNVSKRNLLEEEMAKYTTPMYRAPEMLDTYQNHPIGPAQDIWALGCILYYLCYRQHPFEDGAKLRIINAKYALPDADNTQYAMFHSIIRNSLQPNPYSRPTIGDLCDRVQELAQLMHINLDEPVIQANSSESSSADVNKLKPVNSSQQKSIPEKRIPPKRPPAPPPTTARNASSRSNLLGDFFTSEASSAETKQSSGQLKQQLQRIDNNFNEARSSTNFFDDIFNSHKDVSNFSKQINLNSNRTQADISCNEANKYLDPAIMKTQALSTMGDLFRSAMNYLSQASGAAGVGGSQVHPLVGTTIKLSGISYRVRSQLAEGGYALVFAVQDSQGNWFALKRQLAVDRAATQAITQEINFMRELSESPNIVRFVQANRQELKDSPGLMEFFMLMELCTGGTLIELIQKEVLTPAQISKIFYAVCCAVQHMHDRSPPITHRDLKIENLLFDSRGFIRLCDFGSATTEIFRPDDNWNVSKRNLLEEEMAKYTTPMYRAPEMLDTYQNHPIGPAQDIWALGCILYYLCYRQHPFEDGAKLRIINAKYALPDADNTQYAMFHSIIRNSLQPNPYSRPTIGDLCDRVQELAQLMHINLDEPVIQANSSESSSADVNKLKPVNSSQQKSIPEANLNEPVIQINKLKTSSTETEANKSTQFNQPPSINTMKRAPPERPAPPVERTMAPPAASLDNSKRPDLLEDFFAELTTTTAETTKPSLSQPKQQSSRPNYSRAYFDEVKPKAPLPANAFDDILSSQGFSASSKQANRTLADLQNSESNKYLDPIAIKIRDWTAGKEGNVRALLGSFSDVLWEEAESRWTQPSMAELLSHLQIKKQYRKACLVVHPDKLTGSPNLPLAKAIFTELNEAWTAYEQSQQ